MTRNILYRDFTLGKAAALAVLIGAALVMGGVPKADPDPAGAVASSETVMPVQWHVLRTASDPSWGGVDL